MEPVTSNYREILILKLKEKCERNPRYTQGAFAKFLGLSHSRLSEILSGKQGLSVKWAIRIAEKLKLSAKEKESFCQMVQAEHSRSPIQKKRSQVLLKQKTLQSTPALSDDIFKIISQWHHLAILELLTLNPNETTRSLSRRLRQSEKEIKDSIDRLLRTGQLRKKPQQGLMPANDLTITTQDIPSQAIRQYHQSILKQAEQALTHAPPDEREFSSVIVSVKKEKIAEVKLLLRELRDKFCVEVDKQEEKNAIYCFNIQYFRIDEDEA